MTKNDCFKYHASIDWIAFEIKTISSTNFQTLRRHINISYAEPIHAGAGGASNVFRFKIYDIKKWDSLKASFDALNNQIPLAYIHIQGIEVSLDAFYQGAYDLEAYILRTANFNYLLDKACSNNRRSANTHSGRGCGLPNHLSSISAIRDNKTIYIGNRNESISQRIYFKTTNRNRPLPPEQHSARYEITLLNNECPFETLERAKDFKFTDLAEWFKFRKIKDGLDEFRKTLAQAGGKLSEVNIKRRVGGGTKVKAWGTVADRELNDITYRALKNLTLRLRTRAPRKIRHISI